ncbi:Uncharacterised protein [Yersinia mollaretii]|nr:Uncharacterised protein [Yersinia mollaretii]
MTFVMITMVMAAAATVTVFVVMIMLAMDVTMLQLFFCRFTDSHHFNMEVQILTRQHVVTINHDVLVFNRRDFDRYWALVSICQETHTHFQLVNAHEDIFRHALHQIFIIAAVTFVCIDAHIKAVTSRVAFKRFFQTCDQRTVTVQVVQRRAHRRLIN